MARDICIELGERVRTLRKQKTWRQLDLAQHAELSETYISEIEQGQKEICIRTLHAMARALGTTISELMQGL